MKKFFRDFKSFITKGNVIDLAVAVVIGAAFGKIVTSLVNDIIMPLISLATGGADVSDWKWIIKPAIFEDGVQVVAESALRYGQFIQTIIDFLIIAFFIFLALRLMMNAKNSFSKISRKERKELKKQGVVVEEPAPAPVETQEDLLRDIRELLRNQGAKENTEQVEKKNKSSNK